MSADDDGKCPELAGLFDDIAQCDLDLGAAQYQGFDDAVDNAVHVSGEFVDPGWLLADCTV